MKTIKIILVILSCAFASIFIKTWLQDNEEAKSLDVEVMIQSCLDNVSQEIPTGKALGFCECATSEVQKLDFKVDANMSKREIKTIEEIRTRCKLKLKIR